jgi:hypothetical protein
MRLKLCLLLVFIISFSWAQTTRTFVTNGTFPVPNGVTSINVSAWGGGGSGGGASGAGLLLGRGAAGGGGGAFASSTLTVTPGATLNVVVAGQTLGASGANGSAGGNSTITGYESLFLAAGGSGGAANNAGGTPIGGLGGTVANSKGTVRFAGLSGGNGSSALLSLLLSSGPGGAGANAGGAGGAALSSIILGTAPGNPGSSPGGGGGGAINSALGAPQIGGTGAAGQLTITYTCPTYNVASTTATNVCASSGTTSTVTLTSGASSLPAGNYVVTYNRSNPSATALTANLTVSTAGTGVFTAVGLNSVGSSTITVTKIASQTCSSTISANNTATVTISPVTVAGTVTGGTTINAGSTSGLLTLSGHTGSVVKWQSAVSPFTTWVDIANTNTTYTSGVLTATTQFRAVVQSGACAAANSAATTVTVEPLPTITGLAANSVCTRVAAQSTELNYSATTGSPITYSIVWNSSPANSFEAITDAALPSSPITITVPAGATAGTYTGTLTVKNANGGTSTGSVFTVTINEVSKITSTRIFSPTCAGSQISSLAYSATSGSPISYAVNWDTTANAAFLVDIPITPHIFSSTPGTFDIEISANALPGTYQGLLILRNEFSCSSAYPVTITIIPATVGGTVTGGTTINSGETSDLMTLSGHTGSVVKWQSAVSPFTTWVDIANTNTTYTSGVLTETTQFRAVVQSGSCAVVNSEATTVTVEDIPVLGLVNSFGVCSSANEKLTTLFYSVESGSPVTYSIVWDSFPANSFADVTDAVLPPSPINITVPAGTVPGTYGGTFTVKNSNGGTSAGVPFTLPVNATPTITTDGEFLVICANGSSQVSYLFYTASSGNPTIYSIDWDNTANAAFLADIPDTSWPFFNPNGGKIGIEIPANVLPGTYNGLFTIDNGLCSAEYPVTITIIPATVGGTVTGGTTITSGNTSGLLTLSGHTGDVIKWQSAVSPFTTWVDIANTNTTYTSGVLTETTQFRAVVQNGSCAVVNSEATTVTVQDIPTIDLNEIAHGVCTPKDGTPLYTALGYDETTGEPLTYSIVWDSSPANSFVPVVDALLDPNAPIALEFPSTTESGVYSGTLTVKNASGAVSQGSVFTVTVTALPSVTTTGIIAPVTTSTSSQTTTLAYSASTENPTYYFIDWDSTADDALLTDVPFTSFTFLPSGGIINIDVSANVPAGTYYGNIYIGAGEGNFAECFKIYPISIVINPVRPTITLAESTNPVCSSNEPQGAALSYSATTGSPVSYSIVWDSSPANSFAAVTDAALPASPIKILVPGGTDGGTYTGTLTVKDANGVVSTGSVFTVTIIQSPEVTVTTTPQTSGSLGSILLENLPEGNWAVGINPGGRSYQSNTSSLLIDNLASGTYSIRIKAEQGCGQDITVGVPYQFFAPEDAKSADNTISIASKNKVINVETLNENIDKVLVYDMSGSLLYKKEKISDSKLVIDNLSNRHQILIVKVVLDNNRTETKKVSY